MPQLTDDTPESYILDINFVYSKLAEASRSQGPISATGRLPRTMEIVSPRSTASSRSEKCRDASVAVIVLIAFYLIIRLDTLGPGDDAGRPRRVLEAKPRAN